MSDHTLLEELQSLCDELELYGVRPPILRDLSLPLNATSVLPHLVESTWNLINLLRETVHANTVKQDEAARLKCENRQLQTEISLLKRRLVKFCEQAKLATDRADLATRELNNVPIGFGSDFARQKSEALAENEKFRRRIIEKDAEVADLKNKLQSALESGKITTRIRPKPVACSEREAALKQVICKYQEANQLLIEENLSLVRLFVNQDEDD